jgi:DNA gyrase subunit A
LRKAEAREHIVKGLLIALQNLDEVIRIIKNSPEPKKELMDKFGFSEKQVESILETKLRQLSSMEHQKLKDEENNFVKNIGELKFILSDEKEIFKIIKTELKELKEKHGDERRSQIIRSIKEIQEKDLVEKKDVVVTVTDKGYIKRMPLRHITSRNEEEKELLELNLVARILLNNLLLVRHTIIFCCSQEEEEFSG